MKEIVTIALCIHKRTRFLPELAQALVQQKAPPPFTLLCILNQSPADTRATVEATLSDFPSEVRILEEPRLGLSHARNLAVSSCQTPWLAFLDDDAIPRPDWLHNLISEAERLNAKAAGGRTVLRWNFERPSWFLPEYDKWLSFVDHGKETRHIKEMEYVVGANMLYHTSVFNDGLKFDPRLGRKGDDLLSNEELAIQKELRDKGHNVYYVGSAQVDHIVAPERVTPEWVAERVFAQGRSWQIHHQIQYTPATRQAEESKHLSALLGFTRDFKNYREENWHKWMSTFSRYAGYLSAQIEADSLDKKPEPQPQTDSKIGLMALEWGMRQFTTLLAPSIRTIPKDSQVAIVGAGIAGKWVHDICAQQGITILAYLDDFEPRSLTGHHVYPVSRISELKVDAVILATLHNEKKLHSLISKAGYRGPVICQSKPVHKELLSSFPFSTKAKPRDGLPGRDWPLNVQIQTTSVCNARCIICPYPTSWHKKTPGVMSLELLDRIMTDLEQYHLGKLCLYLQNEPLCDRRWFDIAQDAVKRLKFDRFEISTNASLLGRQQANQLCALLKNIPHEIWISFQGADRESYERIMGLDFDRTLDNLEYFLKLAGQEELIVRVHGFGEPHETIRKAEKLYTKEAYNSFLNKFADDRGIPRFPIRFFRYHDRAGHLTDERFDLAFRRESLRDFYCHRIDTWLHILYTGEITVCCDDYHREHILGDLRHQSVRDFFRSESYQTFRDKALGLLPSDPDFICKRCIGVGG